MSSDSTACDAFMAAFDRETQPHPFSRAFRIWKGRVVFEVHPLRRSIWNADVGLSFIQTLEHGQGHGSLALDWFLNLAREHGAIITGSVQRTGTTGLSQRALRAWYKRHGFTVNRTGDLSFNPGSP